MKKRLYLFAVIVVFVLLFGMQSNAASDIAFGDSGESVIKVQKLLTQAGYLSGEIDGIFGHDTENAVKQFQEDQGKEVTGIVDSDTLVELTLGQYGSSDKKEEKTSGYTDEKTAASNESLNYDDLVITENPDPFSTDEALSFSLFQSILHSGLNFITIRNNPELVDFDVATQHAKVAFLYITYLAEESKETTEETIELYTDKLIYVIQKSYPNIKFDVLDFCWCVPYLGGDNLYYLDYWCENQNGTIKREATEESKEKEQFTTEKEPDKEIPYDAVLDLDESGTIVFTSEDVMDRYLKAVANGNKGTMYEIEANNQVAIIESGTKCNIVKTTFTKCQVKLLEGTNQGKTVWTFIEALKYHN